jgi:hypothetical protein
MRQLDDRLPTRLVAGLLILKQACDLITGLPPTLLARADEVIE